MPVLNGVGGRTFVTDHDTPGRRALGAADVGARIRRLLAELSEGSQAAPAALAGELFAVSGVMRGVARSRLTGVVSKRKTAPEADGTLTREVGTRAQSRRGVRTVMSTGAKP
ncbi:hypothetical protein [Georgenia ruanii]|uniref:hypothetical protein n=1 Tax=Georgenia ruanii TaxID=348442 RepID=UPI00186B0808|nr:hypothetical protein [Georgenia ruanii]